MTRRRLTLKQLRKILRSFGVREDKSRGKGSHTYFYREFEDGKFGYPIPKQRDVLPAYVKGCRQALRLTPEDGVSDDEFFSRA